jgi:uncharacterized protein GlcG (DUF336 family)
MTLCSSCFSPHETQPAALAAFPDIAPLAGGVAIKAGDDIIAALGVAGSPGGDKDEACARAGVASIQSELK